MTRRLFIEDVPSQVVQNLITAIDPTLLTEHSLMLLCHDLRQILPIEELPNRLLEAVAEYLMPSANGDDDDGEDDTPATH